MGSSARKRANKKADFVKPKLKVGKARPKNTNFTDTSFSSKSIHLPTQSLRTTAPTTSARISTHLAHLTSHSASQRSDHLSAFLNILSSASASTSTSTPQPLPVSTTTLLSTFNNLILDPSHSIRTQLPKLYSLLAPSELKPEIEKILPYIRAGVTHLSSDIRISSLDLLAWLLENYGEETVSCPGGWIKTLKTLTTILGWQIGSITDSASNPDQRKQKGGWTSGKICMGISRGGGALEAKVLSTLALLLRSALVPKTEDEKEDQGSRWTFPLGDVEKHLLVKKPNSYSHLNLFGPPREEEAEMYVDAEDRGKVFARLGFKEGIAKGCEGLTKMGGEIGRAAASVGKVLKEADM